MKNIFIILHFLHFSVLGQISSKFDTSVHQNIYAPEIFTSGFIDIMNSGQINASARFVRISIGEPGKFSIPISVYGGVSNNTFQSQQFGGPQQNSNDQLINQYISPLSGLVNISVEGIVYFNKKKEVTKGGWLYHAGERVLTGYKRDPFINNFSENPNNFLNSFIATGLYFQTGAWERNDIKNVGVFWAAFRYIVCYSNTNSIKNFLPGIQTNGLYHGFSIGFGIEINNLLNIKAIFYKYVKKPEIDYSSPIYQFSFNYSLKN